ncbi:hypothetical protein EDD22DRAFT_776040, partial [Suillus occidentalis]
VSHSVAILCTIFRLAYRGWMHHLWWEDAWAAIALIADVVCLAFIWLDRKKACECPTLRSNTDRMFMSIQVWILTVAFTSVQWAARMSIVFSIIRVTNHSNFKVHRRITYLIAVSFVCMWVALLAHRLTLCAYHSCRMGKSVAFSVLITDIIADFVLVVTPLKFWRNTGLSRSTKILVLSSFSASILITAVTIPHSIILIKIHKADTVTIIFAHVKSALSLVVCNLLVIVTFVYRVCWKETFDLDQPVTSRGVLTSVVFIQMPCTNSGTLLGLEDGEIETEVMNAKSQDESTVCVEEGTGTQAEH